MGQVKRRLAAAMVRLDIGDLRQVDAEWCFGRYFAKLSARFEGGFNPGLSMSGRVPAVTGARR